MIMATQQPFIFFSGIDFRFLVTLNSTFGFTFILQLGRPVDGMTVIIDMENCGTWMLWGPGEYWIWRLHYNDVIMSAMASQITSLTIVYSAVYSGAHQEKLQSSASLVFVWRNQRWPVNSPLKEPVTRKMLQFDDVIMYNLPIEFVWGSIHWKWWCHMFLNLKHDIFWSMPLTHALWYFDISVIYPKVFGRVKFVVTHSCFVTQQYLWNIVIRCPGYSPLGEKSLWKGTIELKDKFSLYHVFVWIVL